MDRNPTSSERLPPRYTASKAVDMSRQPLRYSRRPIYILIVYLFFLLIPWIIVCVVNRQITSRAWDIFMQDDLDRYERWMRVAPFFSTVTAVIALPCVAALLAHGAVVYSQRRSHQQSLSLRQVLALADNKWTASLSRGDTSPYLLFATGLLLLAAVQLPLQSLLMPVSARMVYPCESSKPLTKWDRTCDGDRHQAKRIGKEPEPALLKAPTDVPNIMGVLRSNMINITSASVQQNLWRDGDNHRSFVTGPEQKYDEAFWVSAMPAGTTTGPLRQHSVRLSSTADCLVVASDEFPSKCDGFSTALEGFGVGIRICMPDNYKHAEVERVLPPPRQQKDIEEFLFIDAQISSEASQAHDFISDSAENVTIMCTAKTTRAFFELGNFYTKLRPSGIVGLWPTDAEMREEFHDYDWLGNLITAQPDEEWNRDVYGGWASSQGPLRPTVESLFGEGSYPRSVLDFLNQTFPDGQIPENLTASDDATRKTQNKGCALEPPLRDWQLPYNSNNDEYDSWYPSIYNGCTLPKLPKSIFRMAQGLRHSTVVQSTLGVGMYLSNVAVLQDAASNDAARTIYNLTGTEFVAPRYSLGATVGLSALISIQAICLTLLVWYICRLPTWTETLDSFAMMRIGAQLKDTTNLPPLGRASRDDLYKLGEVDGLIGVVPGPGTTTEDDLEMRTMSTRPLRNVNASHQYEVVRPASRASSVSSISTMDLPAVPPQTRQFARDNIPGMSASDLSSYLQGGGLASPSVSSVSSVASFRSPSPPPPYLPATSSTRDQRAGLPYELGLGAPGLVTKALWKRNEEK